MAKFTAGTAVSALDWDFTKYQPVPQPGPTGQAPPVQSPWAGTIPEPSLEDIEQFETQVRAVAPTGDPTKLGQVGEDAAAVFDTLRQALATLCKGQPSLAQIEALPFRLLVAFVGFLMGQLADPQ